MAHIAQTVKSGNVEIHCTKCGVTKEINMSKARQDVDRDIKTFEKDHKHPVREK